MHSEVSGVAHKVFQNDIEAISSTRKLMSYLPQNCNEKRAHKPWTEQDRLNQSSTELLNNIVPHDPNKPYDMLTVIKGVSDRNHFYEMMPSYAKNIITGFAEVEGRVVGMVAN